MGNQAKATNQQFPRGHRLIADVGEFMPSNKRPEIARPQAGFQTEGQVIDPKEVEEPLRVDDRIKIGAHGTQHSKTPGFGDRGF